MERLSHFYPKTVLRNEEITRFLPLLLSIKRCSRIESNGYLVAQNCFTRESITKPLKVPKDKTF